MRAIRIGAGAGFSGDRIEPAVELAEKGSLDYLVFECLAERTIALAQLARRQDPSAGYDTLLEARMRAVLPACRDRGVRIVSNMGAANPRAAARRVAQIARELGQQGLKVAAVTGDDVLELALAENPPLLAGTGRLCDLGTDRILSANAYLGADGVVEALANGADVVIAGRVADPALFLGPLVHEFGWARDDWAMLAAGVLVGHLLECAGQLSGGYFADPGVKPVADLARLGFPFAQVSADGSAVVGKAAGSGGRIDLRTVKEQLLYELADPSSYLTPDVTADFSAVRMEQVGPDAVALSGARGRAAPDRLKVSVGYLDGFAGEGQIAYAGAQAVERGRLALEIVEQRLALTGVAVDELRRELIGVDAILVGAPGHALSTPGEVRARIAARCATLQAAQAIGAEVEALYTNGPAGGGGVTRSASPIVAIASALLPRARIRPQVELEVA
ncbi:MAG: acyclic terpene utilization AtuA family protein [Phenylobacterium sp.]|uniref:acyclic terpene utilization AtuA family protein n=1 Tax=Phenylobacterium sp. TaxID=1871053 RepID=UPI0025D595E3|nr:acyclic terpene utilization AtuA family protein [Phenylobacterium sp.]MBI1198588.1 acyclic terpene utilization AtuA family protein [Phenylobacterium sp.]